MAGKIIADTIETGAGADISTSYVVNGSAKHWTNFNAQNTASTRGSFNQSSLTDNATGNFTVALVNSMNDTNYTMQMSASDTTTDQPSTLTRVCVLYAGSVAPTTSQYKLATGYSYYTGSAFYDTPYNFTEIKGDLA